MIQKISMQTTKSAMMLARQNLQRTSYLKNLNGSSMSGSLENGPRMFNMIVPGGLSKKEDFVMKLTGKIPQSVRERWFEDGSLGRHAESGDIEIGMIDGKIAGISDYTDGTIDTIDFSDDIGLDDTIDIIS